MTKVERLHITEDQGFSKVKCNPWDTESFIEITLGL